jgi:hypothetical protein
LMWLSLISVLTMLMTGSPNQSIIARRELYKKSPDNIHCLNEDNLVFSGIKTTLLFRLQYNVAFAWSA